MAKILLVEDDNNLREIYGARLEAEGHLIVGAGDGEEALAAAIREKPDLIISDVMMPKISGFDMLDILRSTPETQDIKVIVMTALSQDEDRLRGEQLGANKYVVKSQVTLDDIVVMVQEILEGQDNGPPVPAAPPTSEQQLQSSDPASDPAPFSPPTDLTKEVESFVANSPLMNGSAPSTEVAEATEAVPQQITPASVNAGIEQTENPDTEQAATPQASTIPITYTEQDSQPAAPEPQAEHAAQQSSQPYTPPPVA